MDRILSGAVTLGLHVDFLSHNNHTDTLLLSNTRVRGGAAGRVVGASSWADYQPERLFPALPESRARLRVLLQLIILRNASSCAML